MRRAVVRAICVVGACAPGAAAQLTQAFQMSGQLGYEVFGFGQPGQPMVLPGLAQMSMNVPPGAQPLLGFVYTNDYLSVGPMGQPIGGGWIDVSVSGLIGGPQTFLSVQPFASGPPTVPVTWSYGVPLPPNQIIVGPGAPYQISANPSATFGNAAQMHGAAMVVIYQAPSLPMSTITMFHGVEVLGHQGVNQQSVAFTPQPGAPIGAGQGVLSVLTFGDDSFNSGETIDFNGTTVAMNIDGNLGNGGGASIFNIPVTTLGGGLDQATITTNGDLFGWHLALLQSPVPAPGAAGSLLALAGMLAPRRPRRR